MYGRSVFQPGAGRRFGHEAGELAGHLRMRGDGRHRARPGRDLAVADARLRAMVDDDRAGPGAVRARARVAAGAAAAPARRRRGRARSSRRRPGAAPARSSQSSSASSCTIGRRPTSRGSAASAAMTSGASGASNGAQPTTPATNGVRAASVEQPARFGDRRRRLHEDRRVDAVAREDRREIGRAEVAVDRRERRREPAVVAALDPPEVLVRVDHPGSGTSARSRPAATRSRHSAGGTGRARQPRGCGAISSGATAPSTTAVTAGWPERERERRVRRAPRRAPRKSRSIRATRSCDVRRRRPVVVARVRARAGREDAGIEDAAQQHADAARGRERQELVLRRLLEQRIAAGEEHAVDVGFPDEPRAHAGIVDADADRAPITRCARSSASARQRAVLRLANARLDAGLAVRPGVDIVDEHDVDGGGAEPQQRLLERAHRPVVRVVEMPVERQAADVAFARSRHLAAPASRRARLSSTARTTVAAGAAAPCRSGARRVRVRRAARCRTGECPRRTRPRRSRSRRRRRAARTGRPAAPRRTRRRSRRSRSDRAGVAAMRPRRIGLRIHCVHTNVSMSHRQ